MLSTLADAIGLLAHLDPKVLAIVWLSFKVSVTATAIAALVGLPVGAWLGVAEFPGRDGLTVILNGMMGTPPVVLGVIVYLALSRSGPLGFLGLLYSPTAMIAAQTLLVIPLIAALARQTVEDAWRDYRTELAAFGFDRLQSAATLLYDCRYSLVVAVLAGLGRAMSEVGAVMIVGGNIDGFTRVMTTAIALETAKGDLALSVSLGIVLISVVMLLNALAYGLRTWAMRRYG
jgi:tungstate transport system permease protein